MPSTLLSQFVQLHVGDFPAGELSQIIVSRADEALEAEVPHDVAKRMEHLYFQLQKDDSIAFSMRDIIKWLRRHKHQARPSAWWVSGVFLLSARVHASSQASSKLVEAFAAIDGWSKAASLKPDAPVDIQQTERGVSMTQGSFNILVQDAHLSASSLFKDRRSPPQSFLRALIRVAAATQHREPVLLVGPTSFKSLLIQTWAAITGAEKTLMKVHLSADTEVPELVGQIQPTTAVKLLQELPTLARTVASRIVDASGYEDPIQRNRRDGLNAQIIALQKSVDAAVADYEERYRSQLSASLSSESKISGDFLLEGEPEAFRPVDTSAYEPEDLDRVPSDQPSAHSGEPWQPLQTLSVLAKSSSSSSDEEDSDKGVGIY